MSRLILATFASFALLAAPAVLRANDSFTAETGDAIPADPVLEKIADEESGDFRWFSLPESATSRRDFAQTFRLRSSIEYPLQGITLRVASFEKAVGKGAPGAAIRITLHEGDNPPIQEKPLLSATGHLPAPLGSGDYITIRFPQPALLPGGSAYTLVFEFETPAPDQWLNLSAGTGSTYPAGRTWFLAPEAADAAPVWKPAAVDTQLLILGAP